MCLCVCVFRGVQGFPVGLMTQGAENPRIRIGTHERGAGVLLPLPTPKTPAHDGYDMESSNTTGLSVRSTAQASGKTKCSECVTCYSLWVYIYRHMLKRGILKAYRSQMNGWLDTVDEKCTRQSHVTVLLILG